VNPVWKTHKCKEGDTLKSIAAQYKNKDPKAILNYPGNAKIAVDLKNDRPLKKGTLVCVLDDKGKCYTIKDTKGKSVVLDEKQYQAIANFDWSDSLFAESYQTYAEEGGAQYNWIPGNMAFEHPVLRHDIVSRPTLISQYD
jgi:hypothetical protein